MVCRDCGKEIVEKSLTRQIWSSVLAERLERRCISAQSASRKGTVFPLIHTNAENS